MPSEDSKPHIERKTLFVSTPKNCEDALRQLADDYNRLADRVEESWEENARLIEQLETCHQARREEHLERCREVDSLEEQLEMQTEAFEVERTAMAAAQNSLAEQFEFALDIIVFEGQRVGGLSGRTISYLREHGREFSQRSDVRGETHPSDGGSSEVAVNGPTAPNPAKRPT